jgi:hypothetical protein
VVERAARELSTWALHLVLELGKESSAVRSVLDALSDEGES